MAFSQCLAMRKGSVSMPVRIRNALKGAIAGPEIAQAQHAAAMAKAKLPKVSAKSMPL